MSSIRFSCNEKLTTFELWVSDKEVVHKNVEVECYIILIPSEFPKALDLRKPCTNWLVEVQHISIVVPRVFIILKLESIIY